MSILTKLVSGVGWGSLSIVIITLFQLFFMAVMARLLEPADFGLIAIANVSLRFYSYFSQVGIAPALIQKASLENGDVNAALALSLSISSLFCLLAYFFAPLTEEYFQLQELALVMQVLSLNFIIFGFSSISQALLRRESKFKVISIIEMISYVLGYGLTGLLFAYNGAGVWALVAAFMTQSMITALLSYIVNRYPISFKHSKKQRKHLISYGARYSLIGFIEFLTANLAPLIIGKLLGAAPAGFFNRASLLAHLPVQKPTTVLTKILFPLISKVSNEKNKLVISFQLSTLSIGSYACAVGIALYNSAYDIVIVLLGDKWLAAVPMLKILALSIAPLYIAHVIGVILDSMAELKLKLRIQIAILLLLVIQLIWASADLNIDTIVNIVLATSFIRLLLMGGSVIKLLNISIKEVMLILMTLISVTIITGFFTYLIPVLLSSIKIPILCLIIDIIAGGLGLIASLLFIRVFIKHLNAIYYLKGQLPMIKKIMEL